MKNMNSTPFEMKKALVYAAIALLGFVSCTKVNTSNLEMNYLCFTSSIPRNFTLYTDNFTLEPGEKFEYKVGDGDWKTLEFDTAVEFGGPKGELRLRGNSSKGTADDSGGYCTVSFDNSSPVECSGDIRTLVDYKNYPTANTANARFAYLFEDCKYLRSAPELPATELATSCYKGMFSECASLAAAPALPAETLAEYCYSFMFSGCFDLTVAPDLPATILAERCYSYMFEACYGLTTAPSVLPAETLAASCYKGMFYDCSALNAAPVLPALELVEGCYDELFGECYSLDKVHIKATSGLDANYLKGWLDLEYLEDGPSKRTIYCSQAFKDAFGSNTDVVPSNSNWCTVVKY